MDNAILDQERQQQEAAQRAAAARLEEQRKKAEEDDARRQKAEEKAKLASMTPEQLAEHAVAQWDDNLFRTRLNSFNHERRKGGPLDDNERLAMVRALRGPRQGLWAEFKAKATKGPAATALGFLHKFCKDKGVEKP